MPTNYYVYKLTYDGGGAPCIENGLLSLAICKPAIRRMAQKGDWIFAFAGERLIKILNLRKGTPLLIYAAQVTDVEENGRYYKRRRYRSRTDCIYEPKRGGGLRHRKDPKHAGLHDKPGDLVHDVGDGGKRARVLLSERYVHLGKRPLKLTGANASGLRSLLKNLGQGHRVHALTAQHIGELEHLKNVIKIGKHTHRPWNGRYLESEAGVCSDSAGEARGCA